MPRFLMGTTGFIFLPKRGHQAGTGTENLPASSPDAGGGTQVLELSNGDGELLRRYTLAWTGHRLQQRTLWASPMPLADAL